MFVSLKTIDRIVREEAVKFINEYGYESVEDDLGDYIAIREEINESSLKYWGKRKRNASYMQFVRENTDLSDSVFSVLGPLYAFQLYVLDIAREVSEK